MMEKNSSNTIIFYAPVGNLIKGFKNGGAEAGCRKTIAVLQSSGYQVILVEKPVRKSTSKLDGFVFIFTLINVWLKLIRIFLKNKGSNFHIAGFYLNQIYFEWLLLQTAALLKVKTIYEIRNGGMIEAYEQAGRVYQWFLKSTLSKADVVLGQGYDYVVFMKEHLKKDAIYYPNYILDNFVSPNNLERQHKKVLRIIYFGRVVPDKNIEFIIEVCRELKILGISFEADIIGGYENDYFDYLNNIIRNNKLNDEKIVFHGRMDFEKIYEYLQSAHFFIFPSKEKREGHSNSLTEAMSCGVVPIVSKAGFNESIVGNSDLVISDFDPVLYANAINKIWGFGEWQKYSDMVYNRVLENYTENIVRESLLGAYI